MPYGGSRSRSEWVTPKIYGVKTKVFLVESWYNSTLALPYRLSHATVYINYDDYATYSMTFKPKAKVRLMTAGWTSCFHDGTPLVFFC